MAAARPSKRNATAMGKRLAEHVMMHAGETSRIHVARTLARDEVAREGEVDRVEDFLRGYLVKEALKHGLVVAGWKKFAYAVTSQPTLAEEEHPDDARLNWTADRPGIQDMALGSVLQIRLTGYGVPVLEIP